MKENSISVRSRISPKRERSIGFHASQYSIGYTFSGLAPPPRPPSSFLLRVKEWRGIELKALAPAQTQIQIIGS